MKIRLLNSLGQRMGDSVLKIHVASAKIEEVLMRFRIKLRERNLFHSILTCPERLMRPIGESKRNANPIHGGFK